MAWKNYNSGYGGETVELPHDGQVLRNDGDPVETTKALLLDFDGEHHWIPKSQIVQIDDDTVEVPKWLAKEKRLGG